MVFVCATVYGGTSDSKKAHLTKEWYPSNSHDPKVLSLALKELNQQAKAQYGARIAGVKVLIVPHAAFSYSGVLASACFSQCDSKIIKRIIILAPCHTSPFAGVQLPSYSSYRLSSGVLPVDAKLVQALKQENKLFFMASSPKQDSHYIEHSVEIQLPFIQKYASRAKIVPLIVGSLDQEALKKVARGLKKHIHDQTIIVVSSDFTHYGPRFDNVPFKQDKTTADRIRLLDNALLQPIFNRSLADFLEVLHHSEANICGKNSLALLLALFEEGVFPHVVPYLIGYDTSRTKGKDLENSVSYVGVAFGAPSKTISPILTEYEKRSLAQLNVLARSTQESMGIDEQERFLRMPLISPGIQKTYDRLLAQKTN